MVDTEQLKAARMLWAAGVGKEPKAVLDLLAERLRLQIFHADQIRQYERKLTYLAASNLITALAFGVAVAYILVKL